MSGYTNATDMLVDAGSLKTDMKEARRMVEREVRFANHEMSNEAAESLWFAARDFVKAVGKEKALAVADRHAFDATNTRDVESSRKAHEQWGAAIYEAVEIVFQGAA